MFFVKATYRGETRKLTFPTCSTFPAFDELCEQLCRVFPLRQGFTISRLLFSPTPVNSIRLLVGQKVQSAEDYFRYLEPYRNRLWPDAMLRLTVLDSGPMDSSTTSHYSPSNHASFSDYSGSTQTPLPAHSISMSCVPPPPILFPSYSPTTTPIPNTPLCLQTPGSVSNDTIVPVCSSAGDNKKEIQALLHNFMQDLDGLLANTFPAQNAETPRNAPRPDITEEHFCSRCKQGILLPTSYYCAQCNATVCRSCFDFVASTSCNPKAGCHQLKRCGFVSHRGQPVSSQPTRIVETPAIETPSSRGASGNGHSTREVVHNAVCDLCDSGIRGIRYKCLICPDFDSCSSCFTITNEQHPNHSFVRIADPADYILRLGSRARHHAVCDVCDNVIYGTRYKCVHPECPDYDLCDRCESHPIPLHPENHPMIKLKTAGMSIDVVQSWMTEHSAVAPSSPVPTAPAVSVPPVFPVFPVTPAPTGSVPSVPAVPSTPVLPVFSVPPVPAVPLPMPVSPNAPEDKPTKPTVAAVQTEPQPQCDSCDWRSVFLPPELQVSNAMFSPPMTNEMSITGVKTIQTEVTNQGSETPSTLDYAPSEESEVRGTLLDSPSSKGGLSVDTTSRPASSPTPPILRNNLDKEREIHVPNLAMRVEDSNTFSGQTLPPGAEFIKTWRVQNSGIEEWPETTELVFTGGDSLTQITAPVLIGSVSPGAWVEISTHMLKVPTAPGNYLGCWSLRSLQGGTFGDSLWVSVNVVEQSESSEECLSSSSIMKMPQSVSNHEMIEDKPSSPTASERLTEETMSNMSSPADLSFDGADWQDFPAEQEEYVILYDDSSSDSD